MLQAARMQDWGVAVARHQALLRTAHGDGARRVVIVGYRICEISNDCE
jgi:hypothetical protein